MALRSSTRRDFFHFSGCMLGGAVGDALGGPIEFLSLAEIRARFGPAGVSDYVERNAQGLAEFTDDTQMTLFTVEGLLLARQRGSWAPTEAISRGYLRWLRTQRARKTGPTGELTREGWLLGIDQMWRVKAPGNTCLSALESGRRGTPEAPLNNSKGCGGVMRVAPIGLVFAGEAAFEQAVAAAALTHGHPSGYLPAGVFAQIISAIIQGKDIPQAAAEALETLARWPGHGDTLNAVNLALETAAKGSPTPETVETLGGGWVGEEALSIALYCALCHPDDYAAGVLLAINHSGDSDSTGSMTGSLLGALLGAQAIPKAWTDSIELRDEIDRMAMELVSIHN